MQIPMLPTLDGTVRALVAASVLAIVSPISPAVAQDVSENRAWQFETPQEQAARAATLDIMLRQRAGVYAAPIYNTTIAHQYNCSVAATALGNSDTQSAVANSPTVTGAASTASGNLGTTQNAGDGVGGSIDVTQRNGGAVGSTAVGATRATVTGSAQQALNSSQSNSGDQHASVSGSSACGFGALN